MDFEELKNVMNLLKCLIVGLRRCVGLIHVSIQAPFQKPVNCVPLHSADRISIPVSLSELNLTAADISVILICR